MVQISLCFLLLLNIQLVFADTDKALSIQLMSDPVSLDWAIGTGLSEKQVYVSLMSGMTRLNSKSKLENDLAESWSVIEGGREIIFVIKKSAFWSDGNPVTASDFVEAWKHLLLPSTASQNAYLLYEIVGAEDFNRGKSSDFSKVGVLAVDSKTLKVRLSRPVQNWEVITSAPATFPIRKDLMESLKNAYYYPGKLVTSGPYRLVSRDLGAQISLEKNPYYPLASSAPNKIKFKIISDPKDGLKKFNKQEVDIVNHSSSTLKIKSSINYPLKTTTFMGFVTDTFPFQDKEVRRALIQGLNRPLLLKSEPSWILAGGFVPSVERGKKKLEGISFNPLKGKMKLRELGFKQSELVPNFKIRILFRRSPTMVSLAEKIKNQWIANLGFDSSSIELLPRDDSGFRDELMLGRVSVFLEDQWVSNTILPDDWISKFVYDRSGGFTHYFSSEMREIYRTGDKKHIQSLESILIERDAVLLPLYYDSKRILISKRVRGLELSPLDLISVGKINFGI